VDERVTNADSAELACDTKECDESMHGGLG